MGKLKAKKTSNIDKEGRREITKRLTEHAVRYFAKKLYSVYVEIGIVRWGKRRVDILAMNHKRHLIVCEIKSGWNDLTSDLKYHEYLSSCNAMYFLIPEELYVSKGKQIKEKVRLHGIGVMVSDGYSVQVKIRAKQRVVDPDTLLWLLTKMSWRGGIHKVKRKRKLANYKT